MTATPRANQQGRLNGKVLIVTGGGSGIGRSIAEIAVSEGAKVAILDFNEASAMAAAASLKDAAIAIRVDVSKSGEVDAAVTKAVRHFGKIDVLANIAGVSDHLLPIEEMNDGAWQRLFDINVRGTALMMCRVLKEMLPRHNGSIINMGSTAAFHGGLGGAAYSSSKGAVISLTKQVARDVADRGVRVNVVAPGPVETGILENSSAIVQANEKLRPMNAHFLEKALAGALKRVPMGRFAKPEEIARGVIFLASDEASFITGSTLAIDGGQLVD